MRLRAIKTLSKFIQQVEAGRSVLWLHSLHSQPLCCPFFTGSVISHTLHSTVPQVDMNISCPRTETELSSLFSLYCPSPSSMSYCQFSHKVSPQHSYLKSRQITIYSTVFSNKLSISLDLSIRKNTNRPKTESLMLNSVSGNQDLIAVSSSPRDVTRNQSIWSYLVSASEVTCPSPKESDLA